MSGIWTIPNLLTIFRIIAIIPMVLLVPAGHDLTAGIALFLFILAAISDFLDGWLARKLNQYSDLGRVLDPIADKVIVGAMLPVLAATLDLSMLALCAISLIMIREFLISGLREAMAGKNTPIMVSKLAKWKTTIQLVAVGTLMAGLIWPMLVSVGVGILVLAALLTVITGVQYMRPAIRAIIS